MFIRKSKSHFDGWSDQLLLLSVLATTKSLLECASEYDAFDGSEASESIVKLDKAIAGLHGASDRVISAELEIEFSPTGPLQELAMANGWHDAYLKLSAVFDRTKHSLMVKT